MSNTDECGFFETKTGRHFLCSMQTSVMLVCMCLCRLVPFVHARGVWMRAMSSDGGRGCKKESRSKHGIIDHNHNLTGAADSFCAHSPGVSDHFEHAFRVRRSLSLCRCSNILVEDSHMTSDSACTAFLICLNCMRTSPACATGCGMAESLRGVWGACAARGGFLFGMPLLSFAD